MEIAPGDIENTLGWVQADSTLAALHENLSQVVYVLCVVLQLRDEVVKTNQHDVNAIVEAVCHGMLEGGSNIFEAKGHDSISECAPWGCECHLVMVLFPDLDLTQKIRP